MTSVDKGPRKVGAAPKHCWRLLRPLVAPMMLFVVWQLMALRLGNFLILPPLDAVVRILLNPFQDLLRLGSMVHNAQVSLVRVLLGYSMAALIGIPLGILMGYSARARAALQGVLSMLRPIPPLAWVPLILAWFGTASLATLFGLRGGAGYVYLSNIRVSMVFIIFISSFFPILINTMFGVRNVRRTLLDSALTLGASQGDLIRKVILPAALPSIFTGLRGGMGAAWGSLVAAEMLPGSIAGLGYLISHAQSYSRTDIVMAGMIAISIIGSALDLLFRLVEEKRFKWQSLAR